MVVGEETARAARRLRRAVDELKRAVDELKRAFDIWFWLIYAGLLGGLVLAVVVAAVG